MLRKPVSVGLVFVQNFAYYRRALRGVRQYVEARPQWLLTSIDPDEESLRVPRRFRPQGLIVSVTTHLADRTLAAWRRPVVNVSAVLPEQRFPRVGVDNARVGQLAAAHFLEHGLRRFAYVGSPSYLFSIERGAAFRQAVCEAGYNVASYEVAARPKCDRSGRHGDLDPALSQQWDLNPAVQRWLRKLPKPVGVFVPLDSWGVQVAEACRRAELRVPEDVALLGVGDDDLYCEMTRPALSSIIVPAEQIGYEAVALLERLLGGEKPPREPILLPPSGVTTRRSTEVLAIHDESVVAAIRYIREHAHLPLRAADVLEHVPIGRRTLERRCRAALGRGLAAEIRRTRLERACRLLAGTDLPIKTVAAQSGFVDFRYLALVIRKELGMSPSGYRRQMRSPVNQ